MALDINVLVLAPPLLLLLTVVFSSDRFVKSVDPREPYHVPTWVPYFGHLLQLLTRHFDYLVDTGRKCGRGIFTLTMPGGRAYVITDLSMAQAVQKLPTVVSTWEMEISFITRMADLTASTVELARKDAHLDAGYFGSAVRYFQSVLKPGPGLDDANSLLATSLQTSLCKSEVGSTGPDDVDLYDWLRHAVGMVTTDALYGKANPYRQPEHENAFWSFTKYAPLLLLPPKALPGFMAAKVYKARATMRSSFEKYFSTGSHLDGFAMVQGRHDLDMNKWGIPLRDSAAFESVMGMAFLHNTVPAVFWSVYYAISDPAILADLRAEAESLLYEDEDEEKEDGKPVRKIDMDALRHNERLSSYVREVLRWTSRGASSKVLTEDALVGGGGDGGRQYLLKKGAFVIIPVRAFSFDEKLWGPSANRFRPGRFLRDDVKPAAFRVFGGGATACPGRFFVVNEIIAVLVTMILRYDFAVLGETGKPGELKVDGSKMGQMVAPPLGNVQVRMTLRDEWRDRVLGLGVSDEE